MGALSFQEAIKRAPTEGRPDKLGPLSPAKKLSSQLFLLESAASLSIDASHSHRLQSTANGRKGSSNEEIQESAGINESDLVLVRRGISYIRNCVRGAAARYDSSLL